METSLRHFSLPAEELEAVRVSVKRGRSYGQDALQRQTTRLLGLEATFQPQGRPPKRSVPVIAGGEVDVQDEKES